MIGDRSGVHILPPGIWVTFQCSMVERRLSACGISKAQGRNGLMCRGNDDRHSENERERGQAKWPVWAEPSRIQN